MRIVNILREGSWVTERRVLLASVAGLTALVVSVVGLLGFATGTLDAAGRPLGVDFSSFWSAGVLALEGLAPRAYDWTTLHALQVKTHGVDDFYPWAYPPIFLIVAALLALLPYVPALIVWQLGTVMAAIIALRGISTSPRFLLAGLGCPLVMGCLLNGQTGFLTASLLMGGILCLRQREGLAGVFFGLLAFKPQFGLLVPVVLLAGGHWRAIATATATVLLSIGVTLALFGWSAWQAFFEATSLMRVVVLEGGDFGFEKFQSAFAWVRLWGGSITAAYAVQGLATATTVLTCGLIWRQKIDYRLKAAALLVGTLLSTPYVIDYDLVVLGMAIALFIAHALETGFRPWEKTVFAVAWLLPSGARGLALVVPVPIGFIILLGILTLLVARIRAQGSAAAPDALSDRFQSA